VKSSVHWHDPRYVGPEPMNPKRILLIDDNVDFADTYEALLGENGHPVCSARSGEEALVLCEEQGEAPSVVVVDLKMPGMNGFETIAALRARVGDFPVIAMSGQKLQPLFGQLSDLGVRCFLPKPFTIEDLLSNIREIAVAA
jgi:CheY-like chemotaxis protein